jgi:hypothetical protein
MLSHPLHRRVTWGAGLVVVASAAALAGACTGSLDVHKPADVAATAGSSATTGGASGGGSGGAANIGGDGQVVPNFPFEPVTARAYVAKVKNLMLGLPATEEEIAAVTADPAALREMVDAWFVKPEAQAKLGNFFSKAFQQAQITQNDFFQQLVIDNASPLPVFAHAKESMSRTALKIIAEGKPFTETYTTHTFMMTPALMALYLAIDQSDVDDAGKLVNSLPMADGSMSATQNFWLTYRAEGAIPLAETMDPASPNFMHFAMPSAFTCQVPQLDDTGHVVLDDKGNAVKVMASYNQRQYTSVTSAFMALMGHATGKNLVNDGVDPLGPPKIMIPADVPPEKKNLYSYNCTGGTGFTSPNVTAQDSIWRPVAIRLAAEGDQLTPFYDLPTLRSANELVLRTPRVGFFTTPAFFANWPSNTSNQHRGTLNQALIVGVGRSINPVDKGTATVLDSGKDGQHSDPNSPCYSCHQTMDPMRNVFRQAYTHSFHAQHDPAQLFSSATFDYLGAMSALGSLDEFAQELAQHPLYPVAWTQKLCYYANSSACSEDDPEFKRIVDAFVASGYDFHALVLELFSSPLVTGQVKTKTREDVGETVSIARQDHLCAALTNRLKLATSLCVGITDKTTQVALDNNVPLDGYLRGAEAPALSTSQTPFYRGAAESLCSYAAGLTVDKPMSRYSSEKKDQAISDFVSNIMGITPEDPLSASVTQLLVEHYDAAIAAGGKPVDALKSTFIVACLSPTSVAVGL